MIRNDDYFEIIKEQNKELAKFRPFRSAYEMKKEIDRLNNIINNAIKGIEDYYYGDKEYKEYDYTLAYKIYHILKGSDK